MEEKTVTEKEFDEAVTKVLKSLDNKNGFTARVLAVGFALLSTILFMEGDKQ